MELATRRQAFAFRLLAELERGARATAGASALCSPSSIHDAGALVCFGAAGATRAELAAALAIEGLPDDDIASGLAGLHAARAQLGDGVALAEAAALFAAPTFSIAPRYQALAERAATVEIVRAKPTADAINAWVNEHTRGKIARLAQTDGEAFTAVTALYFEGRWAEPFDPEATTDHIFRRADGETVCRMMWTSRTKPVGRIAEDARCTCARLPYHGDRLALYALKPARGTTLAALCGALDAPMFARLRAGLEAAVVPIGLPRLQLASHTSLVPALRALGVDAAFDPRRADLSGIGPQLYVDEAIHAARLEVDEAGTVAAAATMMSTRTGGITIPLAFDRPFVVAIVDEVTGDIIVLGAVASPHDGALRAIPTAVRQMRDAMRAMHLVEDD